MLIGIIIAFRCKLYLEINENERNFLQDKIRFDEQEKPKRPAQYRRVLSLLTQLMR
jgi:hypothetical protein